MEFVIYRLDQYKNTLGVYYIPGSFVFYIPNKRKLLGKYTLTELFKIKKHNNLVYFIKDKTGEIENRLQLYEDKKSTSITVIWSM